jgi:cysteine desulfurase
MRVYLDNAATTPIEEEVIQSMVTLMREQYGNPSSIHAEGRKVRAEIENARKQVAQRLNASIGEIFFTSGGTESTNMSIKCAVRDLGVRRIITSPIEHHCVLHSIDQVKPHNVEVELVELDERGYVRFEHLEALLSQEGAAKTLVSLMHANNEVGVLLDLDKASALCREYDALFHSDTVQTVGHFPIDVEKTPVNFLTGSAHKFHGPKGVGFVYINGENIVKPYIDGGSQERNMRGGTENVYGIVGMARALELACDQMDERRTTIEGIRAHLAGRLKETFPDIQVNTPLDRPNLYTVLSVSFPPSPKAEMLLLSLDIAGVSVSGGSACSSGADIGSHVMNALGADPARKTVRFSFSHHNTKEEMDFVLQKLKELLPEQVEA